MASKVTSVAIEFGVELKRFRDDLKKAGKYNEDEIKEMSKVWMREEKAKTREQKRETKKREKAEEEYQASVINGYHAIGAAIAAAGAAFAAMRQHTHEMRTQIAELNRETLILPETLAAIQMAGGEELLGDLRTDLVDFNKKIQEAKRGEGELAEALEKVKRSAKLQGQAFNTTDDILRAFISHIQQMPQSAERAELALKAFGGEGTRFMAAIGSTQLEEFAALTDRFGASITPEAIRQTEEWNKATTILAGLIESTTDVLADEALELAGYGGAIRGLVEDVVVVDARFRVFASNMQSYATMVGSAMKLMGAPGVGGIPEIGEDGRPIIAQNPFQDIIADMKEAAAAIKDPAAEIDQALADLAERYEQLDRASRESTEELVSQADMYEMLGMAYTEYTEDQETADKDREKNQRARQKARLKRIREEAEIQRQIDAAYMQRLAFIKAAQDNLDTTAAVDFLNFEYDKGNLLEASKEIAAEFARFQEFEPVTDVIGGPDFSNAMSEASAALEEPITKMDMFRAKIAAAGEHMDEVGPRLQNTFGVMSDHITAGMGLMDNVMELVSNNLDAYSWRARRTMRTLFQVQKALSISNIIMSTAQATISALMPPPVGLGPVAGIPLAAITAASGVAQIAVVAAEQPPSFHTGGMVGTPGPMPDEVGITALSGEGVVSRRGMATLDAINRGEMPGGGASVAVYGARVFDAVQGDLARMPTSAMSRAIRAKTRRRVGHRS